MSTEKRRQNSKSPFVFQEETKSELEDIRAFRHQTLQLYLSTLDGRTSWSTLIQVLKILVQTNEDRLFVVFNNGLSLIYEAFNMLQMMFHEATACHVTAELIDLLNIFTELVKSVRVQHRLKSTTESSTQNSMPLGKFSDDISVKIQSKYSQNEAKMQSKCSQNTVKIRSEFS